MEAAQQSPLSELLDSPIANKPKKKVTTGKACVLTNAEHLKALQENENEKHERQKKGKQVDILISKNQVLQILYLKHHVYILSWIRN